MARHSFYTRMSTRNPGGAAIMDDIRLAGMGILPNYSISSVVD